MKHIQITLGVENEEDAEDFKRRAMDTLTHRAPWMPGFVLHRMKGFTITRLHKLKVTP